MTATTIAIAIKFRSWSGRAALSIDVPTGTPERWRIQTALQIAVRAGADLTGADLTGADLTDADLTRANLTSADLTDANLTGANLTDAALPGADLTHANLTRADLTRANLTRAHLTGAHLTRAHLTHANLTDAALPGADLTGADLTDANLTGAHLTGAHLTRAHLTSADLTSIKQDTIAEILRMPNELDALRLAIVEGRIDGSTYSGDCACLAGTLAKARGITDYDGDDITNGLTFHASASSPRERFFTTIRRGDTPETNGAAQVALDWIDEAIAIRDNIRATAGKATTS
jgi:hypothetical protein